MSDDMEKLVADAYEDTRRRFDASRPAWLSKITRTMPAWDELNEAQKDLYRGMVNFIWQRLFERGEPVGQPSEEA